MLPANARFKNLHAGRTAWVIGNGPSLRAHDLSRLGGSVKFAMNGFHKHPQGPIAQPDYYLFADGVFFDGSANCDAFLKRTRATFPDTTFFAPWSAWPAVRRRDLLPADSTHYIAFAGKLHSANLKPIDPTRPLPAITNSAQLAIMLAMYMGCQRICLIGMDHDWLAAIGRETHFYAEKTLADHPVAHGEMAGWRYIDRIRDAMELWSGYERLNALAASMGREIVNCSTGGYLDVFPRASFDDFAIRAAA